jgi:Flp pilus assembly protein TadG
MKQIDRRSFSKRRKESGTVAVLVALCLIVIVGFLALALDIGYVMVTRNESQDAADAAALAGARRLGENYYTKVADKTTDVESVSETTAGLNKVATQNVARDNVDIKIGWWDQYSGTFTETSTSPNAVQATVTRRTGLTSGPIRTFVAGVMGIANFRMEATATAAIQGECTGEVDFPIGIGRSWFSNKSAQGYSKGICTEIAINDTMSSCAGWTNLENKKYKWQDVDAIIKGGPVPDVDIGDIIEFGGGVVQTMLDDLVVRFNAEKVNGKWTVHIPVFEDNNICGNPNKAYVVIGYATMDIYDVITTGNNKGLYGKIVCEEADMTRGTCFYAGTYGAVPGLVK